MITMYTAYTTEIDEIDDALDEIFGQLDLGKLKKNSAGVIHCFPEFVETGIVAALCERLPFEVIGMTSLSQAVSGFSGKYILGLTVLTSDDAVFSGAITKSLAEGDPRAAIADAYSGALEKLPEDPDFILAYFPFIPGFGTDALLAMLDEVCGQIPIFGSVYMGSNMGYENSSNMYCGAAADNAIAMLLVHSEELPTFRSIALPERDIRSIKALVTDSEGTVIRTVNDIPLKDYLATIGYGSIERGTVMQVYYPGSSKPVVMSIFSMNEDGSALCGGQVPVGSSITYGEATREGILETTEQCVNTILDGGEKNGALFYPCAGRYFTLIPQADDEVGVIEGALGGKVPYALAYSGGEVCPVAAEDGTLQNRFHNYSLCSCVF